MLIIVIKTQHYETQQLNCNKAVFDLDKQHFFLIDRGTKIQPKDPHRISQSAREKSKSLSDAGVSTSESDQLLQLVEKMGADTESNIKTTLT